MKHVLIKDDDQRVLTEQVKVLYRLLPPMVSVVTLVSLGVLYALWDVVPHQPLMIWMSLTVFALLVRTGSIVAFRRHFKPELAARYAVYLIIGSALTGLAWGIGSVILFPPQLEYQLFLLIIIVVMGAGSMSSLTTYLPVFYAYMPVSLLPMATMMIMVDDTIHLLLGLMLFGYVVLISYFATYLNQSIKESFKLRFENIELVDQLREQKNEAERANQAKSRFLASASHDLRQPLHALTLFTSVLNESIQYPKVRRVVEQINSSVESLKSLFNALLDISQLDAGVMQYEKTTLNLAPLLSKLENDYDTPAKEKGLKIHWPVCNLAVHTDPTLFEQILRNYISNAIRYTKNGDIKIECETNDDKVRVKVTDSGPGIPEKDLQIIFEEFHQLSNPERDRDKGLGLGLAIVKRAANLLDHEIDVVSTQGEGSTFCITVGQASINELVEIEKPHMEPGLKVRSDSLVVVIDDESSAREGMQTLLELWGYDVISVSDEKEALRELVQYERAPDAIIADYRLRNNKTGIQVIHAIHAECHNFIPALIVTGDIAVERLQDVNNSGFQMLHKPVEPGKLKTFLKNIRSKTALKKQPASSM